MRRLQLQMGLRIFKMPCLRILPGQGSLNRILKSDCMGFRKVLPTAIPAAIVAGAAIAGAEVSGLGDWLAGYEVNRSSYVVGDWVENLRTVYRVTSDIGIGAGSALLTAYALNKNAFRREE